MKNITDSFEQSKSGDLFQKIKLLSDHDLDSELKLLVRTVRKITAEIVEYIKEIDSRRLYLKYGQTSMFAYLTKNLGYTGSSAQRRIDAARLSKEVPEIHEHLKVGELNLSQVSMLAQCLRQKAKETPNAKLNSEQKREILDQVKSQDLIDTEKVISKVLDLKITTFEKKHYQANGSVRCEITFTKKEMADLERVKELNSHKNSNLSLSEIVNLLVQEHLKRKDPLRQRPKATKAEGVLSQTKVSAAAASAVGHKTKKTERRESISRPIYRAVYQRDKYCQWKDSETNKICGSKFQVQIDHIIPVWEGGTNVLKNLRLLCSVHNQLKYKREAGITFISDQKQNYIFWRNRRTRLFQTKN